MRSLNPRKNPNIEVSLPPNTDHREEERKLDIIILVWNHDVFICGVPPYFCFVNGEVDRSGGPNTLPLYESG